MRVRKLPENTHFIDSELMCSAQGHNVIINSKPWVEGFSECGSERMKAGHGVRGDPVERQDASRPVQIHSESVVFLESIRIDEVPVGYAIHFTVVSET